MPDLSDISLTTLSALAQIGEFAVVVGGLVYAVFKRDSIRGWFTAEQNPQLPPSNVAPGDIDSALHALDDELPETAREHLKRDIRRTNALINEPDYPNQTRWKFDGGQLLLNCKDELRTELAAAVAGYAGTNQVDAVAFVSDPPNSRSLWYAKFSKELKSRLRRPSEPVLDQLHPSHIRRLLPTRFLGDDVQSVLIVELFRREGSLYLRDAAEFISNAANCEIRGIVTIFGVRGIQPPQIEGVDVVTLIELDLSRNALLAIAPAPSGQ
jgi:hypothetical protein